MTIKETIYTAKEKEILEVLQAVKDPEIPTISVVELGIITKVKYDASANQVNITMTPTFTGCPAIDYMKQQIHDSVSQMKEGQNVHIVVDFSVPWTSDLITEEGHKKIKEFGLATPQKVNGDINMDKIQDVHCPNCGSEETTLNSMFGPTLCRSVHLCFECKETFEAFKPV